MLDFAHYGVYIMKDPGCMKGIGAHSQVAGNQVAAQ